MGSKPNVVYALDFDGVICDSVGESALSALRALPVVWPLVAVPDPAPAWVLSAMRAVRPAVETGFENVLLARAIVERGEDGAPAFVETVLGGGWAGVRDALMQEWGVGKDALVDAFGGVRDRWIEGDVESWVAANSFYPDVAGALNMAAADVFIITTKQTRFAKLLLEANGVKGIPEERIFGYGTGSKISTLKKIIALPEAKGRTVVFLEDRYETLEAVSLSMLGQPLELLLASWGYNTEKTRSTAAMHPFIELLDLPTFVRKLQ